MVEMSVYFLVESADQIRPTCSEGRLLTQPKTGLSVESELNNRLYAHKKMFTQNLVSLIKDKDTEVRLQYANLQQSLGTSYFALVCNH